MIRNPLISVILPVYNSGDSVAKAIDSILVQSYINWELIIVNDGSTDDSAKIINNFSKTDSRILVIQQMNQGVSTARNKGISAASGEYLAFLDSDDWVDSDYLEKMLRPMLMHNVDLVCAGYYEINERNEDGISLHDFSSAKHHKSLEKYEYQLNLFNGVSGVLWAKLFKKRIIREHNLLLDARVSLYEDLLFVLSYSTYVKNVFVISSSIYYYNRLNETGLSRRLRICQYNDLILTNQAIALYRDKLHPIDLHSIIDQRTNAFFAKLLWDNSFPYEHYKKTALFCHDKATITSNILPQLNSKNIILLKLIASKRIFFSYIYIQSLKKLISLKQKLSHVKRKNKDNIR